MPDPITGVSNTNPVTPANSTGQSGAAQSSDATAAADAAGTAAAAAGGADLADVGQTEQLLQSIIQAASNTPGIDQAKVAELQQAIASGAYQANPQSIAQKIVELEAQLGTAGPLQ
jgi:negative regulator of flagellin synthesis FlgM